MSDAATPAATEQPHFEMTPSRLFMGWMREQQLSLAFTTYQAGKMFFVGAQADGRPSVFERTFNRCMGLCVDNSAGPAQTLWMSSKYQLWRFENALAAGQLHDNYDRVYVPQTGYTTGDIDLHDIVVDRDGRVVFVNTLFGCLGTISERFSFEPIWKPPFLTKLAAEDRCHLNGLALRDGLPRYVTAVGATDVADAWREHRTGGGVVVDVESNEIVCEGLSMPHSPRWHNGKLWVLNSGTGFFGHVDLDTGKFVEVAFCPGYLRGLTFSGKYAIAGLSNCRENRTFSGLPLDEAISSRKVEPRCAIQVIDLETGDVVHWIRLEGIVRELYDVVALPNVARPMALGFKSDEIERTYAVPPDAAV